MFCAVGLDFFSLPHFFLIQSRTMARQKRMRCRRCMWYNYDFIFGEDTEGSYCGLHGGEPVIPDAPQMALMHTEEPDCGFTPKQKITQLELQF